MANKKQQAAYPPKIRNKWYFLVDHAGKTVDEICDLYAISRKTYYKWKAIDRGSRAYIPRKEHTQTKLKGDIKEFVIKKKMKLLLQRRFDLAVSTTSLYELYLKKDLIRRPQKKLPWYTPLKEPVIPMVQGDVVQMDAKYIWEDNARKYQRTFVDIYTGMQFATVTSTMTAEDTVNAFLEAEKYFQFKIFGVQTDNGSENRGDFHQHLGQKGIAHYFIPKSSPTWDGAVERAHGVIDQEFYLNMAKPWKTLAEYLHWYNHERIHLGKYLNGLTPVEKWQQYLSTVSPLKVN